MVNISRQIIKIPEKVNIIVQNNKLFCIGPLGIRSLKLKVKVLIFTNSTGNKFIQITNHLFLDTSSFKKKERKTLQGTTFSLIKELIQSVTLGVVQKLKLVGVGFRVSVKKKPHMNLLFLKLGYSHDIYFKIPNDIIVECPKPTLIFLSGTNLQALHNLSALLRSFKKPEPYKGKGFLYENEIISLKEGKKN